MASSPNGKEVVRYIKVGWSTSNASCFLLECRPLYRQCMIQAALRAVFWSTTSNTLPGCFVLLLLLLQELPLKFTNAAKPKSMFLEDLVRRVEQERVPQAARRPGRQGFDTLLRYSLQVGPRKPWY
jgi:hypothetical protein